LEKCICHHYRHLGFNAHALPPLSVSITSIPDHCLHESVSICLDLYAPCDVHNIRW
jgi:hypothetical protein